MLGGVSLFAVAAGLIAALLASVVGALILSIGTIIQAQRSGSGDPEDIQKALLDWLGDRNAQIQMAILSWMCTLLGGAVTGRLTPDAPVANGVVLGLFAVATGFLPAGPVPRRVLMTTAVVSLPCAVLGAILGA